MKIQCHRVSVKQIWGAGELVGSKILDFIGILSRAHMDLFEIINTMDVFA